MFSEDDLLPLSGLQHLLCCERQCALIHIEQQWVENRYTAEGRLMHERVDSGQAESRGAVQLVFSLPLRSLFLGLSGKADVVEFHRQPGAQAVRPGGSLGWQPFPVEHKRGRPKREPWDRVQLCAQAMCLEEMLGTEVPRGALYYGTTRHRVAVLFDEGLRAETAAAARRLHALITGGRTPPPVAKPACKHCSFRGVCLPYLLEAPPSFQAYLQSAIEDP